MSDKEMNMAILNKLYEIADKVFNEGVNVKEGNYTTYKGKRLRTQRNGINRKGCGYLHRCSFMLGYSTEQYAVGYCSKQAVKCGCRRLFMWCWQSSTYATFATSTEQRNE